MEQDGKGRNPGGLSATSLEERPRICLFVPISRRVLYAATLLVDPGILEPIYLIEIQATEHVMKGSYGVRTSLFSFDHWQLLSDGSPLSSVAKPDQIVQTMRKEKGLKKVVLTIDNVSLLFFQVVHLWLINSTVLWTKPLRLPWLGWEGHWLE